MDIEKIHIERDEIVLPSHAGVILKIDIENAMKAISREQLNEQIKAFVGNDNDKVAIWSKHLRKTYLPEKFVLQFIIHVCEYVSIKIT